MVKILILLKLIRQIIQFVIKDTAVKCNFAEAGI
jgi:hypothetical protein